MISPQIDIRMIGSSDFSRLATAWPPSTRALGDGQRPEPVDGVVLAVVGEREGHPEGGEHDRLGEDAAHQELAVVAVEDRDRPTEHVCEQQHEHDRLDGGVAQRLGLAAHVQQTAAGDHPRVVEEPVRARTAGGGVRWAATDGAVVTVIDAPVL